MKTLKSTFESFRENELTSKHQVKVYGGLTDGGPPQNELPLDEEPPYEDSGDPQNGTGPRGTGGSSSSTSVATLGNNNSGGTTVIPTGGK